MNLSIIGTGYVGLVTGACFAQVGNKVICVDIDEQKIKNLQEGIIPIYEPGLENMVKENYAKKNLEFSTNIEHALQNSDICFIAVGTPQDEDGSADLRYVLEVAKSIASFMTHEMIVVDKSTVPVGTARVVAKTINEGLAKRGANIAFDVASNPEFLKEGAAISDFMNPDRVVVGADRQETLDLMHELYKPFIQRTDNFITMSLESAEMTKYASNAMLATKISFINEMANICERVGANINEVRIGIGSDTRIGYGFIYPGCGYGGSCFPKDVQALIKSSKDNDYTPRILEAVEAVNFDQKRSILKKITAHFGEDLSDKTFALWGLSFKPQTDDMREATSIVLVRELAKKNANIHAYDKVAKKEAMRHFSDLDVKYFDDKYDALRGADALILVTEWQEFKSVDFVYMQELLKQNVIFDGRNQYSIARLEKMGYKIYQIGVRA